MSEMLEKAVAAVTFVPLWTAPDGRNVVASPELAAEIVRTVLQAIREPNNAMLEAYTDAEVASDPGQSPDAYHCSPDGFAAMIDEVLK